MMTKEAVKVEKLNLVEELERIKEIVLSAQQNSPTAHTTSKPKCKYGCDGSGVMILGDNTACQCRCVQDNYKKKRSERLLEFASLPEDLKDLKVEDYQIGIYDRPDSRDKAEIVKKSAIGFIKNYELFAEEGKGLYFYSKTPGSGKSSMAVAITNELLNNKGAAARYTTMSELLSEIKATYSNNSQISESQLIDAVKEVELLVLDEIGVEKASSWVEEIFYQIINNRLNNKKVTIFTSNLLISELNYSHRIKSRITRMTERIVFPEEDVRLKLSREDSDKFKKILLGG